MVYQIEFYGTSCPAVHAAENTKLSQMLTVINSPLLFGCRTGVCGTCLVQVEKGSDALKVPDPEEVEALDIYAPGNQNARLACQLTLTGNITLKKLESV